MEESKLELFTYSHSDFYTRIVSAVANFAEVELKITILDKAGAEKAKKEVGSLPYLKCAEGTLIQSNAISKHIARISNNKLHGADEFAEAEVEQWMWWATKLLLPSSRSIVHLISGQTHTAQVGVLKLMNQELMGYMKTLDTHLEGKTYLVGDTITVADIQIASYLLYPIALAFNSAQRNKSLNLLNWFYKVKDSQQFIQSFGNVKLLNKAMQQPQPPKEEKKKDDKKDKKDKKKDGKKGGDKKQEGEKKKEKKEKPKERFAPTKFILDDFKMKITNSKTTEAKVESMKWFWENFDAEGWSLWHIKYDVYEDEGAKCHMMENMLEGFMQRADFMRKLTYAVQIILGDEPNLQQEGVWMMRGTEILPESVDHPQFEFYQKKQLDHKKAEDRKMVENFWTSQKGDKVNGMAFQVR